MFTEYLLVQKLTQDGGFKQFLSSKGKFGWNFSKSKMHVTDNKDIFPIEVDNEIEFHEVKKGSETSIIADKKKRTVFFQDNYAVLKGFTIVIILPQNYIPISLSFGEKTLIPIGKREKAGSTGYFDILYNNIEKNVVIVFNIYEDTYFQFSCLGAWAKEDYRWRSGCFKSDADAVIKINALENKAITIEDVIKVQKCFNDDTKLEEVVTLLNELIEIVYESNVEIDYLREEQIKKKIGESLNTKISLVSSIVSLADSYINGGVIDKLIASVLMMVEMYIRG